MTFNPEKNGSLDVHGCSLTWINKQIYFVSFHRIDIQCLTAWGQTDFLERFWAAKQLRASYPKMPKKALQLLRIPFLSLHEISFLFRVSDVFKRELPTISRIYPQPKKLLPKARSVAKEKTSNLTSDLRSKPSRRSRRSRRSVFHVGDHLRKMVNGWGWMFLLALLFFVTPYHFCILGVYIHNMPTPALSMQSALHIMKIIS